MRSGLLLVPVLAIGCGHSTPAAEGGAGQRLLLSYDDGRAAGMVVFPNSQYESIIRFELPEGEHQLLRLWWQAASAGNLAVTVYDSNKLDSPGEIIGRVERQVSPEEISNGRDGRWLVQDVSHFPRCRGIIWLGMKKVSGSPTVWSSRVVSGRYFLRSDVTDLLPVKETPLARIELAP